MLCICVGGWGGWSSHGCSAHKDQERASDSWSGVVSSLMGARNMSPPSSSSVLTELSLQPLKQFSVSKCL